MNLIECLGEVIAERRLRLGMSQEDLSRAAGVDRAFISKVELGRRNPSFGLIGRIAAGLNISYARLVHNCEQRVRIKRTK